MSVIHVGPSAELNVFQVTGNTEADRQTPMFGRGRIDHLALQAESIESFEEIRERLMARGAADDFVTDFGSILSVFFRDPDGLEGEVCVANPDAQPGVFHPPGTPAPGY
jgi:catechol 2,3-dioxygenase-like lactoylglutathione lyase family enzyme